MKTVFLAVAIACATATSALAETFKCNFSRGGGTSWISNEMYFKVDPTAKQAWVQDGMSQRFVDGWYQAKLNKNNSKRYTVSWKFENFKNSKNQRATLLYKLTYQKSGGRTTIQMRPAGYDNSFNTGGTCQKVSG